MSEDERTRQLHKAYQTAKPKQTTEVYDDGAKNYQTHMSEVGYNHLVMTAFIVRN